MKSYRTTIKENSETPLKDHPDELIKHWRKQMPLKEVTRVCIISSLQNKKLMENKFQWKDHAFVVLAKIVLIICNQLTPFKCEVFMAIQLFHRY